MGYKGTMRSVKGSVNRSIRASEVKANQRARTANQQQAQLHALQEKLEKKKRLLEEGRSRPLNKLKEIYAGGKIDKKEFEKLKKRDEEISIDMLLFGGAAIVKLGERYLTGKIDTKEFESLKKEILGESEEEREYIVSKFEELLEDVNKFVKKARSNRSDTECNYCSKPKKLLSPIMKEADFKLCLPCKSRFRKLRAYPGHNGDYYQAQPTKANIDDKTDLELRINETHWINYR